MPNNPPNILFIQADQLSASILPAYGNAIAITPHLDELAARSTVFESAYTNFPLCAPSRFSMMSGRLASRIGAYDNGAEFPSSVPTVAHYLRHLGYHTCLIGKMHFVGADQLHGFEERLTGDIYPADFGWSGDWTEISQAHSNDTRSFSGAGPCTRNVQMDYDEEVVHRAERKIYDLKRGSNERPFFLLVSLTHPHDPYQCCYEHWERYRHDDIDMPRVERPAPDDIDPYSLRLLIQYGLDNHDLSEANIRIARHGYYGSVSYLDDLVGRLLNVLRVVDLADNTIVVFTSDHGDMLGEHGLWYKKTFFENSARVPLFIRTPHHDQHSRVTQNVSLVDLAPTLLSFAGSNPDVLAVDALDGNNMHDLMAGNESPWPDTAYSENLAEGAMSPILMVRKGPFKYISSDIDPPQLFDLANDTDECNNLAEDPAHQATRNSLATLAIECWNSQTLSTEVKASQRRRLFLCKALAQGSQTAWDFTPHDQAADHYLRAGRNYNEWAYSNIIKRDR